MKWLALKVLGYRHQMKYMLNVRKEIQLLLAAFMFYTRIPVSKWVKYDESYVTKCVKYLPLVGWCVGGLFAGVFIAVQFVLSPYVAVILAVLACILFTGAFHEDGLADTCDGFGGGWTKDKILSIMKDSRVGTYGAIGLFITLLLKIVLLVDIYSHSTKVEILFITLSAHSLSRFTASSFLYTHEYARTGDDSKAKVATSKISILVLLTTAFWALLPLSVLVFINPSPYILLVILPLILMKYLLGRYFTKWIGGYTGDCLGATQQIGEIIFYVSILILWKFI